MALPVDLGNINIYMGNSATLILTFLAVDYVTPGKTFRSQIRASASDGTVKAEWAITTALVGADTVVTMTLTGDPAIGQNTGQTRQLGTKAVFDVERLSSSGVPEETMATGTLLITQDVTR